MKTVTINTTEEERRFLQQCVLDNMTTINKYEQELSAKIDEAKAKKLINSAIEESKNYTDVLTRVLQRKERENHKLSSMITLRSIIAAILIIPSLISIYLYAGTIDTGNESLNIITLLISSIFVFLIGVLILGSAIYKYEVVHFLEEYTIIYKSEDFSLLDRKYVTKTTNARKAYKRFQNLYKAEQGVLFVKIIDEDGNEYNKNGILIKRKDV